MHIAHNMEDGYQQRFTFSGSSKYLYRLLEIPEKDIIEFSDRQKDVIRQNESISSGSVHYQDGNIIQNITERKIDFKNLVEVEEEVVINPSIPAINNSHLFCTVSTSYLSKEYIFYINQRTFENKQ